MVFGEVALRTVVVFVRALAVFRQKTSGRMVVCENTVSVLGGCRLFVFEVGGRGSNAGGSVT